MDEFPTQWDSVSTHSNYETKRLRVIGGWIVAVRDSSNTSTNVLFLADPTHAWVLET